MKKGQLPTEPYKGTRDFYPEDLAVQKFIFDKARQIVEKFGYEEYNTPLLEPTELYKAKSGEEIINEQTYSFQDRGERDVTLRPEMTPSVARMVAQRKRELTYPLRWYSIQNFFRYERPQKGRLREFWQLNTDIFGVNSIEAEVEIISLGYEIMKALGAKNEDFVIKINSRKILNSVAKIQGISEREEFEITKKFDKWGKKDGIEKRKEIAEILKSEEKAEKFISILNDLKNDKDQAKTLLEKDEGIKELKKLFSKLNKISITNIKFDPFLTRGFDYYTGIVFEFFDTNIDNKRALFGGGRYDDLLDLFGQEKIPAVGLGMGDVTLKDFLKTRNLLPEYQSPTDIYLCTLSPQYFEIADQLAQQLRQQGLKVAINYSNKKIGDQISYANKKKIPFIICLGEDEIKNKQYKIKNLKTGEEKEIKEQEILETVRQTIK